MISGRVYGYRLVKRKWRDTAFDGEGARLYGGRWNSKGQPCLYLADSISLAILETMVHLNDYSLLASYVPFEVELPTKDVERLHNLPEDWQADPAPPSTATAGDAWLHRNDGLTLIVPSVVVPHENNYVLNPNHPSYNSVVDSAEEIEFQPDPRM